MAKGKAKAKAKRYFSPEARERIRKAQAKRWRKFRREKKAAAKATA